MSQLAALKVTTVLAVLLAAMLSLVFTSRIGDAPSSANDSTHPGITLALTAAARDSLQQSGEAFPAATAGFSAYYQVPDPASPTGFGLNKTLVDGELLTETKSTQRRSGIGTLIDMGDNYSVVAVPILNIDGLSTQVRLYYDSAGWVVAYFPSGVPSSQVWQARDLNEENPQLTDVSRTVFLDAINDLLVEALGQGPITTDQLGYYHWQYPAATSFLMLATARGTIGSDFVSFAVPPSFTLQEVSVSMWISGVNTPCARAILDSSNITGDQCDRNFHHVLAVLDDFNQRTAHTLQLEHYNQNVGASGTLVMLLYSVP